MGVYNGVQSGHPSLSRPASTTPNDPWSPMLNDPSLHRLLLVLGLGAGVSGVTGLSGCVVESYPVSATDTRRVPPVEIPHPSARAIRPVNEVPVTAYADGPGEKPAVASNIPASTGVSRARPAAMPARPAAAAAVKTPAAPAMAADLTPAPTTLAADPAIAPEAPSRAPASASATGPDRRRTDFLRFGELPPVGGPAASVAPAGPETSPGENPSAVQRVTFADEGADSDVAPDRAGRFIVFASTRHRATSDLYLQRTGSAAVTQLTSDPANDVMPALSPDGHWVAFASDRGGTWDLYAKDVYGGPTIRLTDDGAQNLHPSFSYDGKRMVYSSRSPRSGVWEIAEIDLEHPDQRRLVGHGLFPAFSPVSDQIVYQRARERGGRWFSLWTMDLSHENPGPPTEIAASSNAALITPAWSPDGRRVVFCTVLDPAADIKPVGGPGTNVAAVATPRADVWVCDADGAHRARLTRGGHAHLQPAWSTAPDGSGSIYFVSDRSARGSENIYALRLPEAGVNEPTSPRAVFEAGVPVRP